MSVTTTRIEFSTTAWEITAISTDGKFYSVECIPDFTNIGADAWEGAIVSGPALTAAIMLAQLRATGLSIKHSGCAALVLLADSLPADMPRFWV